MRSNEIVRRAIEFGRPPRLRLPPGRPVAELLEAPPSQPAAEPAPVQTQPQGQGSNLPDWVFEGIRR